MTVIDRAISYLVCWLVIRMIPERTLIKFSLGKNFIKRKPVAQTGSDAADTSNTDKSEPL